MADTATHLQAPMNFMNIDSITYHNNQINGGCINQGQGHCRRRQKGFFFCKLTFLTNSTSQVHFMNIEAAITFHINQVNAHTDEVNAIREFG